MLKQAGETPQASTLYKEVWTKKCWSGRNSLPQGRAYQLAIQHQMVDPKNTYKKHYTD